MFIPNDLLLILFIRIILMNYVVIFIPIIQHRSSREKEMSEKWNKAFLLIAVVININIFYS